MKPSVIVVVSGLAASLSAAAQTSPPQAPQLSAPGVKLEVRPSTGLWMGPEHILLEQTTLYEVRKAAGVGTLTDNHADAGGGMRWLCYTDVSTMPIERIWLTSHREMGGSEARLMGVTAELLPAGVATLDCPALPKALTPLRLDDGLWLNDPESSVGWAVGTRSTSDEEWQQFGYVGKVHGSGGCAPDGFDQLNGLTVQVRNGRVSFIVIYQVTTC
jgi:hypothetical protein